MTAAIVRILDTDMNLVVQLDDDGKLPGPHLDLEPLGRYVISTPEETVLGLLAAIDVDGIRSYKKLSGFAIDVCQCGHQSASMTWDTLTCAQP